MSIPFLVSKPSGLVVQGLFRGLSHRSTATRFGIAIQRSRVTARLTTPIVPRRNVSGSAVNVPVEGKTVGKGIVNDIRYFLNNEALSRFDSTSPRRFKLPRLLGRSQSASSLSSLSAPSSQSVNALGKTVSRRTAQRRAFKAYLTLTKPHLTFLVVLTSMASYSLYPASSLITSSEITPSTTLSAITLLFLTVGTALCSASANTLNMLAEPHLDAQMTRTRNRPLVRGTIPPRNALLFAIFAGVSGVTCLLYGTNPTVAALGLSNIILYAGVYTPLKQRHVINTWVGAVVGAIPPLMGWAAAAGEFATTDSVYEVLSHPGGWLIAGLLYCWQFPHFNSLSHGIRHEYAAAGYKMLASVNPAMNGRVAVRYSIAFFPVCIGLSICGVTDWGFAVDSSLLNGWITYEAIRFWRNVGEYGTGKRLFWASVWHLPGLLVLAMAHKKGLWKGVWRWVSGGGEEDEEDEDEGYDYYEAAPKSVSGDYGEGEGEVSLVAGTAR
ncbi:Protoheme IX farnesyltransferase, mitochondrial [Orbilia oligospora]|uniref:Protoheme IX farnesyltransferase, mitochondrial n=1 Tax=Orbilia oligospora TaxID=2813651 RepID=A0A6G1M4B7_ORBOL|nr:Protoheme IX farnesyltransferase, mitochondrial [Orbilia oligospora]KAF3225426.1 Protoheme IX farnesyltransferase, mitochondrial [Orbilia oligospora]KAF3228071.1 Protoheme IX farnesyltransferase, mitochondrial [Orbilia oligospora]KAF3243889.1 Protoheme IX farnesyltransferase, mitochondrial [Orbilia oligospora]